MGKLYYYDDYGVSARAKGAYFDRCWSMSTVLLQYARNRSALSETASGRLPVAVKLESSLLYPAECNYSTCSMGDTYREYHPAQAAIENQILMVFMYRRVV